MVNNINHIIVKIVSSTHQLLERRVSMNAQEENYSEEGLHKGRPYLVRGWKWNKDTSTELLNLVLSTIVSDSVNRIINNSSR